MDDIAGFVGILILAGIIIFLVALAAAAFFLLGRIFYKVPGPDEALVITGRGARLSKEYKDQLEAERAAAAQDGADKSLLVASKVEPDPEFKIVVGVGSWLKPGQRMERLSLAAQQADVSLRDVPTVQGINLHTSATVLYKVGDTYSAIARASRRFAGNNDWTKMVSDVLEGQLRTVVGTMTVEDIWQNREALASKVQEASSEELARLGLQIESFQLKPIEDPSGYIANLAAKPLAEKERDARITRAENDQEAAQRETEAQTLAEQAKAAAKIAQAQARQEADRIEAEANQAKPLAEAKARQAVIEEETRNAELEKDLNRQRLEATTYQEAEAQKYTHVLNAQAQSEAAVIQANAQAEVSKVEADTRKAVAADDAEAQATVVERRAAADAAAALAAAEAEAKAAKLRAEALQAHGEAEAAADEARGLASAKVTREQGMAKAEATRAEAEAMSANKDAVVELELVRQLPAVIAANSQAFARVNNITVTDGVEGLQNGIAGVLQQGLASLPAILHTLKGAGLGAVQDTFPTFAAAGVLDGSTTEGKEALTVLAGKVGEQLAQDVEKAGSKTPREDAARAAERAATAKTQVASTAFGNSVVNVDTSLPGSGVDVDHALDKATGLATEALDLAEGAQEFVDANREQIEGLVDSAQRLKRRTR